MATLTPQQPGSSLASLGEQGLQGSKEGMRGGGGGELACGRGEGDREG